MKIEQFPSVKQICEVICLLNTSVDDCLYVYDFVNDFYYISPRAEERFRVPGHAFHDVIHNHAKYVYPEDISRLQEDLEYLRTGKRTVHNMVYRWMTLEGEPVWINCRGYVVQKDGCPQYMIGCVNEIGARQKADNVSGLLRENSLKTYMQSLQDELPDGFLLRLGLDEFKGINEKLGDDYGDRILRKTAEVISDCLYPGQTLYRSIADEFLILDIQGGTKKDAMELYKNIRKAVDHLVEMNQYEAVFTISGGLLESEHLHQHTYADAVMLSEFAFNEAKRQGKNRCYIFCQEDYDRFLVRKEQRQLLRQAVNDNFSGFEAYFQPIYSHETGMLCGAETLMRFHTEKYGTLSPAVFIPILEETGLIIPAGRWILRQALIACHEIRKKLPDFRISINISCIQIKKSGILNEVIQLAEEYNVPTDAITLELTESGLLESTNTFTRLWARLKKNGIFLALDDFGTGYSNFHYLNDLKPDLLKIDRTFLVEALKNPYEFNLLSLLGSMAHSLGLKYCIEGIETEQDMERVQALEPDYCQGFYLGRPCPYDVFVEIYVNE